MRSPELPPEYIESNSVKSPEVLNQLRQCLALVDSGDFEGAKEILTNYAGSRPSDIVDKAISICEDIIAKNGKRDSSDVEGLKDLVNELLKEN